MEGILKNTWFIAIQVIIVGGQIVIVFLGGQVFSVRRLDQPSQWAVSLLFGALTVPVGMMIRLIPDKAISKLISYVWPGAKGPEPGIPGESRQYGWDFALEGIRDQLAFMNKVRGGRLRHIIHQHPQVFRKSRGSSRPPYSSSLPNAVGNLAPATESTPLIRGSGTSQAQSEV